MIGQNPSGEDKWGSVAQGMQQDTTTGNPSPSAMQAYTRQYAYDKIGNIEQLKQTVSNTFTRNFKYNDSGSNILHSIKKADDITSYSDFTYDVNGNRLTVGTSRNYVWDYADQLKSYYNQTGTSELSTYAQYLYSGGQRVKKLVRNSGGGIDTTIYIDGVFEHRYNSASDQQNLIHVGGVATVRIGDNFGDDVYNSSLTQDTCYKLSNHLGSVSFRARSSGSKVDVEEYYPFGDSSVRTWASKKYRYVGKEKDQESGLYYYGARYYAAWTCRFISVDPLAWEYAQLNSYNYAGNKPINHLDIDGMQSDGGDDNSGNTSEPIIDTNSPPDNPNDGDTWVSTLNGISFHYTYVAKNNSWEARGVTGACEIEGIVIQDKAGRAPEPSWLSRNWKSIVSVALDLSPLGYAKGVIEAITGKDLITGGSLTTTERLLGLIPGGKVAKGVSTGLLLATTANKARKIKKAEKLAEAAAKKGDDVTEVAVKQSDEAVVVASDPAGEVAEKAAKVEKANNTGEPQPQSLGAAATKVGPAYLNSWVQDMDPKYRFQNPKDDINEIRNTVDRIKNDTRKYSNDGIVYDNDSERDPESQILDTKYNYTEWTVKTLGDKTNGARRIVVNNSTGEMYFTPDHYRNFVKIDPTLFYH